jgi:hypothetical protein
MYTFPCYHITLLFASTQIGMRSVCLAVCVNHITQVTVLPFVTHKGFLVWFTSIMAGFIYRAYLK